MTKESHSFVDIIRQFGSDLGIPKVDVDKLVDRGRARLSAVDDERQRDPPQGQADRLEARRLVRAFETPAPSSR